MEVREHPARDLALAGRGLIREAIEHFREAVRLLPDKAASYTNLGVAIFLNGDVENAKEQFRQALRIDPTYLEAQKNLDKLTALRK